MDQLVDLLCCVSTLLYVRTHHFTRVFLKKRVWRHEGSGVEKREEKGRKFELFPFLLFRPRYDFKVRSTACSELAPSHCPLPSEPTLFLIYSSQPVAVAFGLPVPVLSQATPKKNASPVRRQSLPAKRQRERHRYASASSSCFPDVSLFFSSLFSGTVRLAVMLLSRSLTFMLSLLSRSSC